MAIRGKKARWIRSIRVSYSRVSGCLLSMRPDGESRLYRNTSQRVSEWISGGLVPSSEYMSLNRAANGIKLME